MKLFTKIYISKIILTLCIFSSVALAADPSRIFVVDSGLQQISKVKLDGTGISSVATFNDSNVEVAVDSQLKRIFWLDPALGTIFSSLYDGSDVTTVIEKLNSPKALTLDTANQKIYFSDSNVSLVMVIRVDYDGSNKTTLITGSATSSTFDAVAVDPVNNKLYYTSGATFSTSTGTIFMANLDGSSNTGIVNTGTSSMPSLAIDTVNSKLYWSEPSLNRIRRSNLDGTSVEVVISNNSITPIGLAIDTAGPRIYWADQNTNAVSRILVPSGTIENILTSTNGIASPQFIALAFPLPFTPDITSVNPVEIEINQSTKTATFSFEAFDGVSTEAASLAPDTLAASLALNLATKIKYVLTVTNTSTSQVKKKVTRKNKVSLNLPAATYTASYSAKIGTSKKANKVQAAKSKLLDKIKVQKSKKQTIPVKNKIQNLIAKLGLADIKVVHSTDESPVSSSFTIN